MTKQIAFMAYIDSKRIADDCIANPALLAEILHCVAKCEDDWLSNLIKEASEEVRYVYDPVQVGFLLRMLADRVEAAETAQNIINVDDELVIVREATPIIDGVPIPPETEEV